MSTMRAFVGRSPADPLALAALPVPQLQRDTDIRVKIHAVATNPVDLKSLHFKGHSNPSPVGWDASGAVDAVAKGVANFKVGDEVYFSGDVVRTGNFAEFVVVDSRLAALKPKNLSHVEAAAFPLVALTVLEALHESMRVKAGESILIHPGGGGVGSIGIQLAKLAGLKVIATAGRPETTEFAKKMGADHVINYKEDLETQLKDLGLEKPLYVLNTHSEKSLPQLAPIVAHRGIIVGINGDADVPQSVVQTLFMKSATLSFELMLARSMLGVEMEKQGDYLKQLTADIEAGKLKMIHTSVLEGFESLSQAVENQKSGKLIGKQVIQLIK